VTGSGGVLGVHGRAWRASALVFGENGGGATRLDVVAQFGAEAGSIRQRARATRPTCTGTIRAENDAVYTQYIGFLTSPRSDRRTTATTQGGEEGALRCDGCMCPGIIEGGDKVQLVRVVGAHLQSKGTLSGCRQHRQRIEILADVILQPKASQPGGSKHNCIRLAILHFAHARIDIAAQINETQIRSL